MIIQLITPYRYSSVEQTCLTTNSKNWSSQAACVDTLKQNLNGHFDRQQSEKCCYCGLLYDRTGRGEIEHIAPKGAHPGFSFEPYNLAKACQLCNSSSMKHDWDPIDQLHADYQQCTFQIVHPYFDNHSHHYKWGYGMLQVVISVNNNSDKARRSIELFELDSEKRTRARAIQRNQERLERIYNLPTAVKSRIKSVITFGGQFSID